MWLADGIPSGDQGGRGGLVVHDGKVYGLVKSPAGDEVFCLDAANGKPKWKSPLRDSGKRGGVLDAVHRGRETLCGGFRQQGVLPQCLKTAIPSGKPRSPVLRKEPIASSIAVVGNVAVLLSDALTGLDAQTGKVLWTQPLIKGSESSPTTWTSKGRDYVICNTERETHGVDAADGHILWSVPGGGKSTPVVAQEYGGDFLVNMSDNQRNGLAAYRLTDKEPQKLWTIETSDRGSSPVVFDGHVYAVAGGATGHSAHLLSIHLDTGKVAWDEGIDFAEVSSPVIADGKMFVVCGSYARPPASHAGEVQRAQPG